MHTTEETAAAAMAKGKVYGFQEVKQHNARKDCWVIISGKVYDVTPFMEEHPGGDEVLLAVTGKDATIDFEDVGHSKSAREMMAEYCIGNIDSSTVPARRVVVAPQQATPNKSSSLWIAVLQLVVPVLLLVLPFALRNFTKSE